MVAVFVQVESEQLLIEISLKNSCPEQELKSGFSLLWIRKKCRCKICISISISQTKSTSVKMLSNY